MNPFHSARVSAAAVLAAAISLSAPVAHGQAVVLTWVDRAGKVIEQVGIAGSYRGVDLAPDGKRIAAHRHDGNAGDNLLFEIGPGSGAPIPGNSAQENSPAIWSPDGSRVVYGSKRNGKGGVYVKSTDGTGTEELLLESETTKVPMSWSSDGKFIVYWVPGGIQWVLPLTGDRKPFQVSEGSTSHAQISPDGKWIAYQSNETGRGEIYIKSFPPGREAWRVSKEGGVFARWSGDSGELYFLSKASDGKIMAAEVRVTGVSVQPGAPRELFDSGYTNFNHPGGVYHTFAVTRDGQRFLIPRPEKPNSANTENLERNGRMLTLFDREGKTVGAIGELGLYNQMSFSPDGTRLALIQNDLEKGTSDIWVLDLATGKRNAVTTSKAQEFPRNPTWSPDGTQIAYVASRSGNEALYRKASSGEGQEELLYKLNGSGIQINEWSANGNYLLYYSRQLGGNILFLLPLDGERKPIEAFRSDFPLVSPHVSPDNRFLAYRSVESGKDEIWVRTFNPSRGMGEEKWKVSPDGGVGPVIWRGDGKELYFVGPTDRSILAVDVRTESGFEFGAPRLLFKAPDTLPLNGLGGVGNISRDGQRILLALPKAAATPPPPPPSQQISVLDRDGKVVKTIGQQARYADATLSSDGTRLAVRKLPTTGNDSELWSYDIATGEGRSIAKGNIFEPLWSPDGSRIFYVANRTAGYSVICRRAADGSGDEEEVFRQTAGYPVNISDISPDGKFLSIDVGGVIMTLPLTGNARQPTEFSREEYFTGSGRFSENGRFMAYVSNETGRSEVVVRSVDAASGAPSAEKWAVTTDGAASTASWRADSNEMYYFKNDMGDILVMAVDVTMTPALKAGEPRFLFRVPNASWRLRNISRDGQRFAFVTNVPATPPTK